jgi:hypothetical protein
VMNTTVHVERFGRRAAKIARSRAAEGTEDHTGEGEAVNTIVAIDFDEPGTSPGRVLAGGHDFFSSARHSPDASRCGNGAIDGAAAALFAAGIAARTRGRVLWCVTRQDLFAPSIARRRYASGGREAGRPGVAVRIPSSASPCYMLG